MWKAPEPCDLTTVLHDEQLAIAARRARLDLPPPDDDLIGIALSGGGVRSATVCLGVLQTLNDHHLLEKADYLSSVSGGGYTAGYVHATLKKHGSDAAAFAPLFSNDDIDRLRTFGSYLAPRGGFDYLKLVGAYLYSFFMNLVWVLSLFVTIGATVNCLFRAIDSLVLGHYGEFLLCAAILVFAVHFFLHVLRWCCWSSRVLYAVEGVLFALALPYAASRIYGAYAAGDGVFTRILMGCGCTEPVGSRLESLLGCGNYLETILGFLSILIVTGFFANPNILTFHRFYRDALAAAYLSLVRGVDGTFRLFTLNPGATPGEWGAAPYPLVNTCLNLLGRDDEKFAGTSTCEHFILSPLYCGSKLTGYAPGAGPSYSAMTLSTAMAVSGAAVNPDMGYKTNRFLAFAMTILNLRLGYWAPNPAARIVPRLTWWPWYHMTELVSRTNTNRRRVLLSDGGHIENLGVFELLRRRCRLILSVDAGADPDYRFDDLQELIIQARNILGVAITFRDRPEDVIRPEASYGYSREQFAIADISTLPGADPRMAGYRGVLVYLKSSLKAPQTVKKSTDPSYLYKTWHTAFPHESTADQFFDEPQWNAYYTLGKHMAEDLLQGVLGSAPDPAVTVNMSAKQWHGAFSGSGRSAA
jgi:hypothetical protein